MAKMKKLLDQMQSFFASTKFFYIIIGFFVLEALWFVFSAIYPMAFDEDFHFGLIQLYSHHLSPFLTEQPPNADQYGAVARDPSYLYHYLMSFPYRLIQVFTANETAQIIVLRLMNVAMFTWSLFLYRKLMLRAKASSALTNVALAIFVLIPIAPQLAAHINYDNIFMVLMPLMCLSGFSLIESLRERKLNVSALLSFIAICMFMSLIKYAALPLILAAAVFIVVIFFRNFWGHFGKLLPAAKKSYAATGKGMRVTMLVLLLVMSVLFVQRYGVNMAQYKNPVPDCGDVLTVEQCSKYGPWARDHGFTVGKDPNFQANPVTFMGKWLRGMWHRLFFAINGPKSYYNNYRELPIPSQTAVVLSVLGILLMIIWWRQIFSSNILLSFCITITLGYILVLWLNGYSDYDRLGVAVAINGRYLLPVLLLLAIPMGRGIALTLAKFKWQRAKPALAALTILLFLHGGGVFTFILRSDKAWYWPNSTVEHINNGARKVLAPITIEGLSK
ncbi:MAG TPA: hypothetical protein VLA92_05085 [Candidatus Saccharimonadales bacterium]|nr:hypothetical protein [Candidatus Saccharimonadales bacterium]